MKQYKWDCSRPLPDGSRLSCSVCASVHREGAVQGEPGFDLLLYVESWQYICERCRTEHERLADEEVVRARQSCLTDDLKM
jgi:hypothetical protein